MAEKAVGETAPGTAICRMIETYQPEESRICNDTFAQNLIPPVYRVMLRSKSMRDFTVEKTEAVGFGIYGAQVCRTRCIDDAVRQHLAADLKQVVILGAGLDSRPYRLPGMEKVAVFEVDLPFVQEAKKKRIRKTLGELPHNVTFIPIDFSSQDLETALAASTYDPDIATIFIWEGVTQYLAEEDVRSMLSFVGKTKKGGVLIFTYVLRSIIERRTQEAEQLMDFMDQQGSPWYFGLNPDELPAYLKPFHLKVLSDYGARDFEEKYLKPLGRELALTEAEHTVQVLIK
jgi:methyltransferase (TIGR00027 family)